MSAQIRFFASLVALGLGVAALVIVVLLARSVLG
jgi:hypothetical protein